jgi:TPR repeat protein
VEQDNAQAVQWFTLLASKGHALAQVNLDKMHEHGLGVKMDDANSLFYYNKAARKGDRTRPKTATSLRLVWRRKKHTSPPGAVSRDKPCL